MPFVDTHSHIHNRAFKGDAAAAVERARAAGVELIVTLGENLADSRDAIALAERIPGVLAAAGIHPHDAKDASAADIDALRELARDPRVALVGEIGLDFYRDLSPRDVQVRVLREQLAIATEAQKPVAIHTREAQEAMLPLLRDFSRHAAGTMRDGRPIGVMHYFAGDADLAQTYVELGFLISIHTSVTYPNAKTLQEVAAQTPLEHLVIETDSPYGAPHRYRGKQNEPAYVVETAAKIAELRGLAVEAVAEATTANAMRLLAIGATVTP